MPSGCPASARSCLALAGSNGSGSKSNVPHTPGTEGVFSGSPRPPITLAMIEFLSIACFPSCRTRSSLNGLRGLQRYDATGGFGNRAVDNATHLVFRSPVVWIDDPRHVVVGHPLFERERPSPNRIASEILAVLLQSGRADDAHRSVGHQEW